MYNTYNGYNGYANPYLNNFNKNLQQQQLQQQIYQTQQSLQPQQPIQTRVQDIPIQGIKFLTADEIKAYIVMPNTKEMLIDTAGGVAYIKSADQMGQSSVKMYKFNETTEEETNAETKAKEQPKIDLEPYVQKEELNTIIKNLTDKVDKLEKKIKISEIMGEK